MVKLLIAEKEFEETLGYGLKNDAESTNTNLFWKGTAALTVGIFLQNYICQVRGNWIQARLQAAEGDGKLEPDLFDKNLDNVVERVSIYDDDDE